eukprot:m.235828 g.235828  ORF g.235828 m.235828 type:complete len:507 (+) comp26537_c0_seq13:70-1590(+)
MSESDFLELCKVCKSLSAARSGIRELETKGFNVNKSLWQPLICACTKGNIHVVTALLEIPAIEINIKGPNEETALYVASRLNHLDIVQLLLNFGADANLKTKHGDTPLHTAARNNCPEAMLLLLQNQADQSLRNTGGCTPLHLACVNNHIKAIQVLVQHNADPWIADNKKVTAWHIVARDGFFEGVKCFANTFGVVCPKATLVPPLILCAEAFHRESSYLPILKLVTSKAQETPGAVNAKHPLDGRSALHYVVQRDKVQAVEILLSGGADINVRDKYGVVPLHKATSERTFLYLLKHGADINAVDRNGASVLHLLLAERKFKLAEVALIRGINPDLICKLPDSHEVYGFRFASRITKPQEQHTAFSFLCTRKAPRELLDMVLKFDPNPAYELWDTPIAEDLKLYVQQKQQEYFGNDYWTPATHAVLNRTRNVSGVAKAMMTCARRLQCCRLPPEVWELILQFLGRCDFVHRNLSSVQDRRRPKHSHLHYDEVNWDDYKDEWHGDNW